VDTAFFKGNYPEACAIDVCDVPASTAASDVSEADWREVLPQTGLEGHAHNVFAVSVGPTATHVRLRIFPDGGVARLRVYGHVMPDWGRLARMGEVDLGAVEHGGLVIGCSDMFFGSRHNLIMPGAAVNMGDGWETKRRRGPGHDWTIVRLGAPGSIHRVEVDTSHFKGNAPGAFSLEGCSAKADDLVLRPDTGVLEGLEPPWLEPVWPEPVWHEPAWREIILRTSLSPDTRHDFRDEVRAIGDVTHVRLNIYPDGGVARLRLHGTPAPENAPANASGNAP
jgi:allantoicase